MEVQTLSIVVPTKGCVNKCPFCVSKMSESPYVNQIENNVRFSDLYERDYLDRLMFARDNGCNTVILTGDGEPLQNIDFLKNFAHWNDRLNENKFRWIELQTTGAFVNDEMLRFLRNSIRVSTISLSVTDIFNSDNNNKIIGVPEKLKFNLDELCTEIKKYDFNLRISINLIDIYNNVGQIYKIFHRLNQLGADQVIFRVLYVTTEDRNVDYWVREHSASDLTIQNIRDYIIKNGKPLERLPFGDIRYSVNDLSTVLDDDCMPQEVTNSFRYLILRQNCRLYSRWDQKSSLVF